MKRSLASLLLGLFLVMAQVVTVQHAVKHPLHLTKENCVVLHHLTPDQGDVPSLLVFVPFHFIQTRALSSLASPIPFSFTGSFQIRAPPFLLPDSIETGHQA